MNTFKNFLLVMLFSGLLMIFIAQMTSCPPPKIEYRYLPRTLDQLIDEQHFSKDMFNTVFGEGQDVWISSINNQKVGSSIDPVRFKKP